MSAKHTPGPWEIDFTEYGGFAVFVPPSHDMGHSLVICRRGPWIVREEQSHANARLIAAAPELLEALEDAAMELDDAGKREAANVARAAIEKATGGQA
jgi:hypothetical protein